MSAAVEEPFSCCDDVFASYVFVFGVDPFAAMPVVELDGVRRRLRPLASGLVSVEFFGELDFLFFGPVAVGGLRDGLDMNEVPIAPNVVALPVLVDNDAASFWRVLAVGSAVSAPRFFGDLLQDSGLGACVDECVGAADAANRAAETETVVVPDFAVVADEGIGFDVVLGVLPDVELLGRVAIDAGAHLAVDIVPALADFGKHESDERVEVFPELFSGVPSSDPSAHRFPARVNGVVVVVSDGALELLTQLVAAVTVLVLPAVTVALGDQFRHVFAHS